jgi:hypothetical protein
MPGHFGGFKIMFIRHCRYNVKSSRRLVYSNIVILLSLGSMTTTKKKETRNYFFWY